MSWLSAPAQACHVAADIELVATPAIKAAIANEAVRLETFLCNFPKKQAPQRSLPAASVWLVLSWYEGPSWPCAACIVIPPGGADVESDWHWLLRKVNPRAAPSVFLFYSRLSRRKPTPY